jgi:hypothetical protein
MELARKILLQDKNHEFKFYLDEPDSLDEYFYEMAVTPGSSDIRPYLITSSTASTLHLYQFNQYEANFVQFRNKVNTQITQIKQKILFCNI